MTHPDSPYKTTPKIRDFSGTPEGREMTHPDSPYKTTPKIRDFSGTPEGREKI